MDILLTPTGLRGLASFGGLFLFMAIENLSPYRKRVDPIFRHYGVNLLIAGANAAILGIAFGGAVVAYARFLEARGIGLLPLFPVPLGWNIVLSLLFLDFVTYLWHMAYHRWPLLWRLHRVHHTDRDLDVTSASRFHLGEIGLSIFLRLGAMTLWGPAWISMVIFEGALLLAAQFQHSNFKIPAPFESAVRSVFVTPDMHRVHHSDIPGETNSNYSTIFSFWDRSIGTYRMAPQERIVIGLKEYPNPEDRTFLKLMAMPFGRRCSSAVNEGGPTLPMQTRS
ncbi:MAG: sterol desaturase family protein [Candidatus Manganitrophaceae bacterium]|nr:MAG: sterol desaturase family protein [Candidatus Manganitrophaceae bacterium]